METVRHFYLGQDRYEIKMSADVGPEGWWYEVWVNGRRLGERNPWPIDPETRAALTKEDLVRGKMRLFGELQKRKAAGA